jgi:hypothetical protein
MKVKYPNITVDFSNIDGNSFMLLNAVRKAMREAKIPDTKIKKFTTEAQSGNYDHLMITIILY